MTLPQVPVPVAVAIIVIMFAAIDRAWGGGWKFKLAGHGLGKPAALLIFPIMFLLGLPWPLALGMMLAFVAYRSPSWHTLGGDLAPHRESYAGTFFRHCLVAGFVLAFTVYFQAFDPRTLLIMLFPIPATLLAIQFRKWENERGMVPIEIRPGDKNSFVEPVRGSILGALVAAVLVWTGVLS